MKYSELKVGDVFTINRENNETAYIKDELCYQECMTGKRRRKLNGCTKVTKIGETL